MTNTTNTPIHRAWLADDTNVNATITGPDQIVLNVGLLALHMSPELARRITADLTVARLLHDMNNGATQ